MGNSYQMECTFQGNIHYDDILSAKSYLLIGSSMEINGHLTSTICVPMYRVLLLGLFSLTDLNLIQWAMLYLFLMFQALGSGLLMLSIH